MSKEALTYLVFGSVSMWLLASVVVFETCKNSLTQRGLNYNALVIVSAIMGLFWPLILIYLVLRFFYLAFSSILSVFVMKPIAEARSRRSLDRDFPTATVKDRR